MKNLTTSSANPRFTCQVVRFARALMENVGGAHVSSCPDCQVFYRAMGELDAALRRETPATREAIVGESSSELERSIMRAVREAKAAADPAPSRLPGWTWALSGVAAAAVAAVFVFHQPAASSHAVAGPSDDALAVIDAVESFSTKLTERVIPATGSLAANNPLQRELGSVYTDARSALNFLALNFLPGATVASVENAKSARTI